MAQINMHFHKGGYVTVKPEGYPEKMCHLATRPYSVQFGGKQDVVETEGDNSVSVVTHQQQQQLNQGG